MAWKLVHEISVATGTYQKDGQEKKRYQTIGKVMESENGGKIYMIHRSFNPAGVPFKEGSDMIALYMFEPRDWSRGGNSGSAPPREMSMEQLKAKAKANDAKAAAPADYGDIPF